MKINHIAIWVKDLEQMAQFYHTYFGFSIVQKYHNASKQFTSRFLTSKEESSRIELMHKPNLLSNVEGDVSISGLAHIAISVGSKEEVERLTSLLQNEGHTIMSKPRTTGDGNDESGILDPENNNIKRTGLGS